MPDLFFPHPEPGDPARQRHEAVERLTACGAVLGDGFEAIGVPYVWLIDRRPVEGALDPAPFRGRMHLNGTLNSNPHWAFPQHPVRLTLCRWGEGEDEIGRISVGRGSYLAGASLVSHCSVTVGEQVDIAQAIIMDSDGHPIDRRLPDRPENVSMAPVTIEDHAWIGHEAVILKGVTVGHHAVVAARSVVFCDVPPHSVVAGNPAEVVRRFKGPPRAPLRRAVPGRLSG